MIAPLSKGGMGAVYLVRDLQAFGRTCVIKEMLDYFDASDAQAKLRAEARFAEEGRTLASLSHPGIPKIYAFFEEADRRFIVMEYIRGENLEKYVSHLDDDGQLVPRQPISEEEILRYAIQACRILEYLADQPRPVAHQDVKPANLIREPIIGDVRLVDFGTARARRPSGSPPTGKLGPGNPSVYGTMGYAAPEQYRGEPTPRSDVYSLAATLYHLLTDDDPRHHPGQFPKLNTLRADLRTALDGALRPDPASRSSARHLREHLEAILTPHRVIEAFTFPGGERIRSVGALPAMGDKYWSAACEYLYNGDFERWFRDMNRLDLVEASRSVSARFRRNRDAGLEEFLRRLDPGLAEPKLAVEPLLLDLGRVAREGDFQHTLKLSNATRGYLRANIRSTTHWLSVRPKQIELRGDGAPAQATVIVRSHELPLFGAHQGSVEIESGSTVQFSIPVIVKLSFPHELWRQVGRAWRAMWPAAGQGLNASARFLRRNFGKLGAFVKHHPRAVPYSYLTLSASGVAGWWAATQGVDIESYLLIGAIGPLVLLAGASVLFSLGALLFGVLSGAARGVWRTFWK